MLINSRDAERRLNSPDNLLNRLRRESPRAINAKNAISLFIKPTDTSPDTQIMLAKPVTPSIYNPDTVTEVESTEEPKESNPIANQVLDELEVKIKQGTIQSAALDVLTKTVQRLGEKVENGEVVKARDLADIAKKMSGIITETRKTDGNKDKDGKTVHLHFYTPERKKLADMGEIIDVG